MTNYVGYHDLKNEGGGPVRTTLTGVTVPVDVSGSEKVWRTFQAIGDIAFAYAYSTVLIEIQASDYSSSSCKLRPVSYFKYLFFVFKQYYTLFHHHIFLKYHIFSSIYFF